MHECPMCAMQGDFPDVNPIIPSHYFRLARRCFVAMVENDGKVQKPRIHCKQLNWWCLICMQIFPARSQHFWCVWPGLWQGSLIFTSKLASAWDARKVSPDLGLLKWFCSVMETPQFYCAPCGSVQEGHTLAQAIFDVSFLGVLYLHILYSIWP